MKPTRMGRDIPRACVDDHRNEEEDEEEGWRRGKGEYQEGDEPASAPKENDLETGISQYFQVTHHIVVVVVYEEV